MQFLGSVHRPVLHDRHHACVEEYGVYRAVQNTLHRISDKAFSKSKPPDVPDTDTKMLSVTDKVVVEDMDLGWRYKRYVYSMKCLLSRLLSATKILSCSHDAGPRTETLSSEALSYEVELAAGTLTSTGSETRDKRQGTTPSQNIITWRNKQERTGRPLHYQRERRQLKNVLNVSKLDNKRGRLIDEFDDRSGWVDHDKTLGLPESSGLIDWGGTENGQEKCLGEGKPQIRVGKSSQTKCGEVVGGRRRWNGGTTSSKGPHTFACAVLHRDMEGEGEGVGTWVGEKQAHPCAVWDRAAMGRLSDASADV
ncbi:hypothetical protein IW261DRAFT_1427964 [Armillaria novae-zelandiae]|uniref:Uncharacterized protein n=1 Tax=Armillaria novae-zelandiae TaxID=153914 RepID=A0AA39TKY6_9AGAR|nr:hypothetical protein IW261DRAFT_1427964 [Armillaria novae-zelandiae]